NRLRPGRRGPPATQPAAGWSGRGFGAGRPYRSGSSRNECSSVDPPLEGKGPGTGQEQSRVGAGEGRPAVRAADRPGPLPRCGGVGQSVTNTGRLTRKSAGRVGTQCPRRGRGG